jgi:two-component system phosphate regulon sensor histidine kinase PhoR
MKESHIKILTVLGIVAIVFVFVIQIFWVRQAYHVTESQFEHTVTVALRQVAEKISAKNKTQFLQKNPVIKVNPRHYIVAVNSEIDATLLDHYLNTTFDYFNINQDVEYSIYSCEDNTMVYCNYIQKRKPQKVMTLDVLPKFEGLDYYFSIHFPHYPIISMNNIPMWMITSAVLVFVTLFFVYALFVVFYQKSVSQVQKDFINNMTHEFKTPISTISLIQQVFSEPDISKNPERIASYSGIIGDEVQRLNALVEKVLHVSTLEKKEFELFYTEISVGEVVDQVIHTLSSIDFGKKVEFKKDFGGQSYFIKGDIVHFTNIIHNIIENAVKYSYDEVTILIKAEQTRNSVVLTIKDDGMGISKKDQNKIFTKFFRVTTGNKHDVKGFGLGLYYVKQIIRAHRWKIEVQSELTKGTTFKIIIPKI